MKSIYRFFGLAGVSAIAFCGCQTHEEKHHAHHHDSTASVTKGKAAVANLSPTAGNQTRGTVTFTQTERGVKVVAVVMGLTPGKHGFHIHEKGDCSAPDASSAGGHFNPTGAPHGGPDADKHHVGDFGNIVADNSGTARATFVDPHLSLDGPHSIVGRAVIVHADADDLTSQPSGNAGARVACGVIKAK